MIPTAQATAKISKLNNRILHYQEQIANLRNEAGRLGKSKDSQKKPLLKRMMSAENCETVLPMHRSLKIMTEPIPVCQLPRPHRKKTR